MTNIVNTEIKSKKEYNDICDRIKYIIELLDKKNPSGKIRCYSTYIEKLHIHKNSLIKTNPLQILIAEGLYKSKFLLQY
jgi:hypothetical protein